MTTLHHHVLASKLNHVRNELKRIEHYIDAHEDFDIRTTRADLIMVANAIVDIVGMMEGPQHEHFVSLNEMTREANDDLSTTVKSNDTISGEGRTHE